MSYYNTNDLSTETDAVIAANEDDIYLEYYNAGVADTVKNKKALFKTLASFLGFTGEVKALAHSTVPDGWLSCDGSAISRTTYSNLFTAISTTWGVGDGSTTFNVPDLRGVFLRGSGANGTLDDAAGNPFDGGSVGDTANDQMQQITGDLEVRPLDNGGTVLAGGHTGALDRDVDAGQTVTTGLAITSAISEACDDITFDSANSPDARTGDETQPVNATVLYIIKT